MKLNLTDLLHPFQPADILRVEALSNYSKIYFCNRSSVLVLSVTLMRIEEQLPAASFLRIHQSHLINKSYIKKITGGEAKVVELQTGESIAASRRKQRVLKEYSKQLNQTPS